MGLDKKFDNNKQTWFIEINGERQGPFSANEITQLVLEGFLNLQSQVHNEELDQWFAASDLFPAMSDIFPEENHPETFDWQPPERPISLEDTHVIDLNEVSFNKIDYFALIPQKKKENDSQTRMIERESTLILDRKAHPNLKRNLQPNTQDDVFKNVSFHGRDDVSGFHNSPDSSFVKRFFSLGFFQDILHFGLEHKNGLLITASLGLIFTGTYGIFIHLLEKKNSREPAANLLEESRSSDERNHHQGNLGQNLQKALQAPANPPQKKRKPRRSYSPQEQTQVNTYPNNAPIPAPEPSSRENERMPEVPQDMRQDLPPDAGPVIPPEFFQNHPAVDVNGQPLQAYDENGNPMPIPVPEDANQPMNPGNYPPNYPPIDPDRPQEHIDGY